MKTENIKKALESVSGTDLYRPLFHKPFAIGLYIYSTNACAMLRVPKYMVDGYKIQEDDSLIRKCPSFFKEKFISSFNIKYSVLSDIEKMIPTVDEYIETNTDGECKECEGSGEVEWEFKGHCRDFDCPVCEGEGNIPKSKRTKSGRKIFDENSYIDIKSTRLSFSRILELKAICDSLNIDLIEVSEILEPSSPVLFKIGPSELILMPVIQAKEQNIIYTIKN
ncbi:hypothetical protein Phi18:3_gp025 [Cellulophaga phage phi18:3]|uniref:Uncharacterized protein n=1 Tax=Cellulophaga phage phi18:3 TaxID=1327983 RepID=S0A256_9CAUD|nr:hypothetical protein Phi18:3_gp025 [Cellulophaga phage phi18:3]AGO48537.1 hypothetical protein Phi18:3_gp025 [Cellulophaga phage phi18:3]